MTTIDSGVTPSAALKKKLLAKTLIAILTLKPRRRKSWGTGKREKKRGFKINIALKQFVAYTYIMAYTPPEYPSTIPGTDDLPDRVDDLDWIYAARYNELKKELRAVMIELGVLPKGGSADVKTRLDNIIPGFADRGDPAAEDFTQADLTLDDGWHDLDLSAIVPAGAKTVVLRLRMWDNLIGQYILLRKNGNTNTVNISTIYTDTANATATGDCIVALDANRVIEYRGNAGTDAIRMSVAFWAF